MNLSDFVNETNGMTSRLKWKLDPLKLEVYNCMISFVFTSTLVTFGNTSFVVDPELDTSSRNTGRETSFLDAENSTEDLPKTPVKNLIVEKVLKNGKCRRSLASASVNLSDSEAGYVHGGDKQDKSQHVPERFEAMESPLFVVTSTLATTGHTVYVIGPELNTSTRKTELEISFFDVENSSEDLPKTPVRNYGAGYFHEEDKPQQIPERFEDMTSPEAVKLECKGVTVRELAKVFETMNESCTPKLARFPSSVSRKPPEVAKHEVVEVAPIEGGFFE